jgi:hypothetical protein
MFDVSHALTKQSAVQKNNKPRCEPKSGHAVRITLPDFWRFHKMSTSVTFTRFLPSKDKFVVY